MEIWKDHESMFIPYISLSLHNDFEIFQLCAYWVCNLNKSLRWSWDEGQILVTHTIGFGTGRIPKTVNIFWTNYCPVMEPISSPYLIVDARGIFHALCCREVISIKLSFCFSFQPLFHSLDTVHAEINSVPVVFLLGHCSHQNLQCPGPS